MMREFAVDDGFGVRWVPVSRQMRIGRGRHNDLVVASSTASRRHAWVWCTEDQVILEDLGSTNGTFINGLLVTVPQRLHHNDLIVIGDARLRFVAPEDRHRGAASRNGAAHRPDAAPSSGQPHWMASQVFCAHCGRANAPRATLCAGCGQSLSQVLDTGGGQHREQGRAWTGQPDTPVEPVVARPFPSRTATSRPKADTAWTRWALLLLLGMVAVALLIVTGVLLAAVVR